MGLGSDLGCLASPGSRTATAATWHARMVSMKSGPKPWFSPRFELKGVFAPDGRCHRRAVQRAHQMPSTPCPKCGQLVGTVHCCCKCGCNIHPWCAEHLSEVELGSEEQIRCRAIERRVRCADYCLAGARLDMDVALGLSMQAMRLDRMHPQVMRFATVV